jgi:sugar lactone lactonase YvrE
MRTRRPLRCACALTLLLAAASAWSGEVRTFAESAASLGHGTSGGVAVTDRGRMFLSPEISRLGQTSRNGPAHVWALIADDQGNVYLGTGPDGEILRSTPAGNQQRFFKVDEPMVTALAWAEDGDLLAGTAPQGRIYKIGAGGRGAVWAETGERYVWSLWVGPSGRVFAGTGEAGRILVLDTDGEIDLFYDSDEAHVVQLVGTADGTLYAGGAGRGRVYQIDAEGHAHVLHDDDLAEVTGLALGPDGHVAASLLAPPEAPVKRPAVRIQLPDGAAADSGGGSLTDLDEERPTLEGFIEGLPEVPSKAAARTRGRVIRISPDGAISELWRSTAEAPLSLSLDSDGRVVFGTGEPARLWRVELQGDVALLSTAREAQVTAIVRAGRWLAAATSNPAGIYRIERRTPESGLFHSRAIDAGGPARWGRITWNQNGPPGAVEFYTRTGNSSRPDETWSAWSPALTSPTGSPIVNPDGRFLQWRARLLGGGEGPDPVSGVQVTYAPYNRAPELDDFRLEPVHGAVRGEAVVRLRARDPDGDPLRVELQYRARGADWRTAVASEPSEASGDAWRRWRDERIAWDTTALDEGTYTVRAVASDQGANHPDEGLRQLAGGAARIVVDRTAPSVETEALPGGVVRVEVQDDRSGVRRLELVRDGRVHFSARPEDGVCDSRRERFELEASDVEGEGWTLRAFDAAGNRAEQPLRGS